MPSKHSAKPSSEDPLCNDFRNFLWVTWQFLGLPPPTDAQMDMAFWLQHGPRRAVLEGFRGVGKSWITGAFVCWLLYCDADHTCLVVSASKAKADEFSTFVLRLLHEMPLLQHLAPRHGARESMVAFDVYGRRPDIAPSVKSVGITGQVTGSRAATIVADDIEVPNNSDTQVKRDQLAERVKEFDAVLKPGGKVVFLGTPQTENSIYNQLPHRGYVIRQWPARVPEKPEKYLDRLAPMVAKLIEAGHRPGSTVDPLRFSDEDLAERELSYGKSGFALQFMLDTELSDAEKYPLKLSDLIVYPCDTFRAPTDLVWASDPSLTRHDLPTMGLPGDRFYRPAWICGDFAPYAGAIMFVDPSGRGKDETAYVVSKQLHGKIFIVAAGGFIGGYDQKTLTGLLSVAKKHHCSRIICEPNYGGGMFTKLLQAAAYNTYQCAIEDADWQTTQKEKRIVDILEPALNQHRIVMCPSVIQSDYENVPNTVSSDRSHEYRLIYQMARITKQPGALAHDDRLDALAGAVRHWTDVMAQDSETAALAHKDAILEAQLGRFVDHAMGKGFYSKGGLQQGHPGGARITRH